MATVLEEPETQIQSKNHRSVVSGVPFSPLLPSVQPNYPVAQIDSATINNDVS